MPRSIPTLTFQVQPSNLPSSAARMKRRMPTSAALVALALLGPAGEATAQAKRCDLVGRDTTVAGNPARFKKCLDLARIKDSTITVPSNVTRIDNDGLSLCKGSLRLGGDADIIFVMDQSGSMGANYAYIDSLSNPRDTIYYENKTNCGSSTTDWNQFQYRAFEGINAGGNPVPVMRTVRRISHNTGCNAFSGDPYKVRATAVEKAIDHIASSGTQISTVGFVGFSGVLEDMQAPVTVNAANVSTLKNTIDILENGGTNYFASINQAKTWFNTPALMKTGKKAMVFISDGRPTQGGNALTLIDGTVPPIYSIYLAQRATLDTAVMKRLSDTTGGRFYRVPGNEPDSVVKIVQQILNLILKEFQPNSATVTNNSLAPTQSATAAMPGGFTSQPDGSWLMNLSDVIALRGSNSNSISVRTNFLETGGPGVDTQTISFTIATTGPAATGSGIVTGTQFDRVCYDPSRLRILDGGGSRPTALTESDDDYQLHLRTAPIAQTAMDAISGTRVRGDDETPSMARASSTADSSIFLVTRPFAVSGTNTDGDGTLHSAQFDTVVARWQHPRDAQDFAVDTLRVRAANVTAEAWFSLTDGGAITTTYQANQTTVFVVIKDQSADPRLSYTALITNDRFGSDSETVVLRVVAPGLLGGSITVSNNPKTRRDGTLQVSVGGDQLQVTYTDPVYLETVTGRAGFDENIQEAPRLHFTDENFAPLPDGTVWPPSKGKLYFTFSDDYAYGRVPSKAVSLLLNSLRYGALIGDDGEGVNLALVSGSSGTRANWTGSIDLADAFPPVDSNNRAESRYRGEARASANGHDNVGASENLPASDSLLIAYPDSAATLSWRLADSGSTPTGTEGLIFTVKDQNFSVATNDSAAVTVLCARSGDSVSAFAARESSNGTYVTGTLTKDEGIPNLADRILSCLSADQIVVRYVDPVFGTTTELVIDEVARPVADPRGRRFLTEEFVSITTATPGAVIHFTLDGSTPTSASPVYGGSIQVIGTTVIKAIAVRPGWKDSKVMVETYTKDRTASRLELLDENGNEVVGGFLAGSATAVRIKITTTQAGLGGVQPILTTRTAADEERPMITDRIQQAASIEYQGNIRLLHPVAGNDLNDTLEARGIDTLIAIWTNPLDPTDVARDTLIIKPAFKAAEVYFTEVPNGPKVTRYADTQSVVYITVKTSPRDPSLVYQVTVTATELGLDDEVVTLTEVSPGTFLAQVPVVRGTKSPDVAGTLQVSAGADLVNAVFVDPIFKDSYRGDVGFGQDVQESAVLEFVRQDGTLVPPDEIWNPDLGKVYLRYSDDWLAGIDSLVHTREAKINIVNKRSGAVVGTDEEDVTLTLASNTATRGTWLGSVELRDRATTSVRNDTLETYYRGEAVATMVPHTNKGVIGGAEVSDQIVIAYPNKPAEILIKDTAGGDVDRADPRVVITVRDQENTKSGDNSITVTVSCDATGDRINSVKLTWNGTEYVSVPPIIKAEGGEVKNDSILVCRSTDRIVVTFPDPVHNETKVADVRWSDQKAAKLFFASAKDSSAITSVADGVDNKFLVIVEGLSPTRDKADTIDVVLTTTQGEKLTVKAIETGLLTGIFRVEVSYQFITRDPDPTDNRLDANINRDQRNNRVIVTAEATIDGSKVKAELALFSAYNMVVKSYIKDSDGNGRADKAYFVFDKKLARLPSSMEEVAWNEEGERFRQKAGASMISFLNDDSNVVVVDFTKSQFGANLTHIPSGRKPYGLFPTDNLFGGQLALLADSVGPVPVTAVKRPSNLNSYSVSATEKRFYPDTLIVTVSEALKTSTSWDAIARFSKGCAAYDQSAPLRLAQAPEQNSSDPLTWTLIVDNSPQAQIPLVGDCIFLETDGRYTDREGNRPSPLGVPITGENPKLVIRDFRGFPPVAGVDPGSPGFTVVNNNTKKDGSSTENRWSTQSGNGSWQVVWIPPVGFDECKSANDIMKCMQSKVPDGYDAKATPKRDIENQSFAHMPVANFSAVQVIATGRYIARVNIYDNFGVHVRSFVQAFGFWGEEKNPWRATDKGLRSFIVWDLKDKNGQMAGQGVYVWKVNFSFSDKKSEVMYTRTGVMRN